VPEVACNDGQIFPSGLHYFDLGVNYVHLGFYFWNVVFISRHMDGRNYCESVSGVSRRGIKKCCSSLRKAKIATFYCPACRDSHVLLLVL
jgi:hypothetical protein